jgi:hypothetical protein
METEKIITLLSIIAILLIIYRILISKEDFDQIDICDYNSPDPNDFCKSIQKGCANLINENNTLNTNINKKCTSLPTNTRDMIDTAVTCSDDVNKLIMNNYVQKEICTQIKNFPDTETILNNKEVIEPSSYKPVNFVDETDLYFLNGKDGFAPF